MFTALSSAFGTANARSSDPPASSLFGASASAGGDFPRFGGSVGNSGFGFGGSILSSAAGTSLTASSAQPASQPSVVSAGFGTSPLVQGNKAATLVFGMTSGMPQFGATSTASSATPPFAPSSAFYLSQSGPAAATSASSPAFTCGVQSSASASFGFGGLASPSSAKSSAAPTTNPFSGFSLNQSGTPVALTASSAFGTTVAIPSQMLSSSSTFFGLSSSGSLPGSTAPTSSFSLKHSPSLIPSFSHPASSSPRTTSAPESGLGFPLSTASAPFSATPAVSSVLGFAASTPALSIAGGFCGATPAAAVHVSSPASLGGFSFSSAIPDSSFEGGCSLNLPAKTSAVSTIAAPSSGFVMASGSAGAFNFIALPTAGTAATATQRALTSIAAPSAAASISVTSTPGTFESLSNAFARTPKPPSEIFGKTVEEIIKEWSLELHERTLKFRKQAESLGEWDRRIIENRNLLIKLESAVASVVESQHSLQRQLELIETHQQEVEKSLESMEDEAIKLYRDELPSLLEDEAAATRDMMFEQAEFVDRELERLGGQIKETILNINSAQGNDLDMVEVASPLDLVVRILNNQLTSLIWIDEKAGELSVRILSFAEQSALVDKGHRRSRLRGAC